MPGETRSFLISALEKIRHQTVESIRLIPLHPVGALIEQVKFCVRNQLEEQDAALYRHTAVPGTPSEQRLFFQLTQFFERRPGRFYAAS
jgi:hypothetical protein